MIEIDGQPRKQRFLVRIDGEPVWLTLTSLVYLVTLAHARIHRNGWVHKMDIQGGDNVARYIHLLKQESRGKVNIDNDSNGSYRLVTDRVVFNVENLKAVPHHDVSGLFEGVTCD